TAAQNERFNAVSITLDGKWLRVKNGTAYGYVKTEDVSAEASVSGDVYVCDNTLPVYAIADAASEKLGTMAYGEKLVLLSVNGSWAEVRNDAGVTGYCDISGLTYQNLNILSLKVYAVEDGVQVYSKPDTAFTVIKTANKNDSFTAVAVTIDELWLRVQTGSGYGYILAEDLSVEKTETGAGMMVYVSANILPVYQSASTSAKVLGSMAYGEALLLHDQNGTWVKVQNEKGEIGYCSAAGLTIENPNNINKTGYVSQNGVKVYKKPDASSGTVMTLNKNSAVTVLAVTQDSKWMRIAAGAAYGYVPSEYIQESEAEDFTPITVYVAENLLKVYKSASESSKVMGTMAYGEAMKLTGVNDGWAEVMNTSGEKGYCSYGGLTDVDPNSEGLTMYAQDATPIYKKPSTGYGTVANVGKNAALSVVAITPDGDWARVYIGSSKYGYAQMSKLAQTEVPSGDEFADENFTKKTVYGIATATTCYASPSTSSKSVGNLYFGQSATCTGENGDWARVVNGSGTVAYCKISNISTENPNKYSVAVYAKSAGTKVYQKPSTSSSVIATVGKNGKCTGVAVSTDGKWYRLKNGSTYGYALASDFSTSIIQENDSGASAKIKKVIAVAEKQYGKKYVYGAEGPNTFDCSGLIIYAFKNGAGITSFPRTAEKMGYSNTYPKVSKISDLKVGDLVFFDTSSDNDLCDHVGIYLGGGYFVHASSAAAKVVKSNLNSGYYNRVFSWGRRVLQ
ncbi:MAG: SH3 domain-containing protein, partial [Clostridia bacterium]|nr:SH3 domain-containing protein [Clostridia bacterium]